MNNSKHIKKTITAIAILTGTVVGAGILSMPYVSAQSGFLVVLGYLLIFGGLVLWVNLCFGEVLLRTRGEYYLMGIAERYLGKTGKEIMFFLVLIAVYSALIAYMLGVGESLSHLIFQNSSGTAAFGALFGFFMSYILWGGVKSLKKYEIVGVSMIGIMTILIILYFLRDIQLSNLLTFNNTNILLPFGVVLFSLVEFYSLPTMRKVMKGTEKYMKAAIVIGMLLPLIFYILFNIIVVGYAGTNTPQVSTIFFGPLFIILGIVTMFTSYLSLGTALERSYLLDYHNRKKIAWFKASILPIVVFLILQFFEFFSFVTVISIGGVVSGGLIAVMIIYIHRQSLLHGNRKPEYTISRSKLLVVTASLLFIAGIFVEITNILHQL